MINLLVTGGYGFIGSNFINYIFKKNKYNIINLDAMYYCANESNVNILIRQSNNYKFIKGNLCDTNLITFILKEYDIQEVIHFAAQSHVQNSFDDSLQYTQDNIVGTHTLLESCRIYGKITKFTINKDKSRVTGSNLIDKKIVFIGGSNTLGWAVDDFETFTSIIQNNK